MASTTTTTRVIEMLDRAAHLAATHGLDGWKFSCDRSLTRAGCCRYSSKTISLSYFMLSNQEIPWHDIKNIVLHEIAHAIVGPGVGHGKKWKNKALEIGCDGKRCHSLVFAKPKYRVVCGCGACDVKRHRMPNALLNKRCKHCGGLLHLNTTPC